MGPLEILILAVFVLVLFGATRLPRMGRSLGEGLRGFSDELSRGIKKDDERGHAELETPRGPAVERPEHRSPGSAVPPS